MDIKTTEVLREDITRILECLLNSDERKCNSCKKCEDIDACCFLTDAVFVCKQKMRIKSRLAS
jgi:hypothetical protein